jgi:HAD superfamily hydrolase (TIGR01509 family)
MIEAVIFDMDGVLLDSEPFWQDAEIEIFASVGIHLTLEQCRENAGIPINEIIEHRFQLSPWNGKSPDRVRDEIMERVEQLVRERAVPREGVVETLAFFRKKNVPIALASSSTMRLIAAALGKLHLGDFFSVIHSAEQEKRGKPSPDVFLTTAKLLGTPARRCLVFEDSLNGLKAAKAAKMKTVVTPMEAQRNHRGFDAADLKLNSLREFTEEKWIVLNALPA